MAEERIYVYVQQEGAEIGVMANADGTIFYRTKDGDPEMLRICENAIEQIVNGLTKNKKSHSTSL